MVSETGIFPPAPQPTGREQALADELRRESEALVLTLRYHNNDQAQRDRIKGIVMTLNQVVYRLEHPKRQGIG